MSVERRPVSVQLKWVPESWSIGKHWPIGLERLRSTAFEHILPALEFFLHLSPLARLLNNRLMPRLTTSDSFTLECGFNTNFTVSAFRADFTTVKFSGIFFKGGGHTLAKLPGGAVGLPPIPPPSLFWMC